MPTGHLIRRIHLAMTSLEHHSSNAILQLPCHFLSRPLTATPNDFGFRCSATDVCPSHRDFTYAPYLAGGKCDVTPVVTIPPYVRLGVIMNCR